MCGPNLTVERKVAKLKASKGDHLLTKFAWEFRAYKAFVNKSGKDNEPWVVGTAHCKKCGKTITVTSDSYRNKYKNVRTEGLDFPCTPA